MTIVGARGSVGRVNERIWLGGDGKQDNDEDEDKTRRARGC